jgi:hypothetical protein
MKTLTELGLYYNTDKATYHHFTEIYETYFSTLKEKKLNILEIGIFNGGSLRTLKDYFYNSNIYGIDFDRSKCFSEDRILSECGDQTDINFLNNVFSNVNFDIIIDDGGHTMPQQQISLETLLPRLKSDGIYILEDLHTSYSYGYGSENDSTTLCLLEKLNIHDSNNHSFFIKDLHTIQENILDVKIYYTNDKTSVTSVFKKK